MRRRPGSRARRSGAWQESIVSWHFCHLRVARVPGTMPAMQIAILVFPKLTALDAIGPYEVLSRLPGFELTFVAAEVGRAQDRHRPARDHRRRDHRRGDRAGHPPHPGRGGQPAAPPRRARPRLGPPRPRATRPGPPRSARARSYSAPPGCSRASAPPATGPTARSFASTAPSRWPSASSRTAR